MFGNNIRKLFVNESATVQEPITPAEKLPTAEEAIIAELSTLTAAGSGYVPPAVEPIAEAQHVSQPEPAVDPNEERIVKFIRVCHLPEGIHADEMRGACGIPKDAVMVAINSLLAKGIIRHNGAIEVNHRRYMLTASEPEQPVAPPAETQQSRDAKFNAECQARWRAENPLPAPPKPTVITDAEVEAELAKMRAVKPISPEERRDLEQRERNRRPVSQNLFIKRQPSLE
jgi:hypothetical protein